MVACLLNTLPDWILLAAVVLGAALTFILTHSLKGKLPTDVGRAFAVNADKAKGKPRGAGIIFVLVFIVVSLLFINISFEYMIYCLLMICAMLAGFLDDASRAPWGEYKKGFIDLLISLLISITFVIFNPASLTIAVSGTTVTLPGWLYVILGTVLVWASVNVTNCTDGVDGLSSSLTLVSLGSFYLYMSSHGSSFAGVIPVYMACVGTYLLFNASPSILLMGDAGSRTIGVFFALAAMKSGSPLLFLPFCLVFILDGGLGLIKVSLLRFLKIRILKNTRTPLHDHFRKTLGWSDTQTVVRFTLVQLAVCAAWLIII